MELRKAAWRSFAPLAWMALVGVAVDAHADCFSDAAARYRINVDLLRAIGKTESNFDPLAINPDSHAMGVMQIHPVHLPTLQRYKIEQRDLYDPCTNIRVGAWVLAGFIQQYGPVWRAVGAYGVGNDRKKDAARQKYAQLVASALARIEGHAQTSPGASLLGNSPTHMAGGELAQTRAATGMQVID